jgi:ribosomal protein L37AE/L43A
LRLSVGEAAMSNPVEPCEIVPNCPVCASKLHVAHSHAKLKICVCRECGTSLSIPDDAWLRARMIREKVKAE